MLEHTIVSHLSKIFFNCFVEDGIGREEREEREERMNVLRYMVVTLSTFHVLKSLLKTDAVKNTKKEIMMKKNKTKKMTMKNFEKNKIC